MGNFAAYYASLRSPITGSDRDPLDVKFSADIGDIQVDRSPLGEVDSVRLAQLGGYVDLVWSVAEELHTRGYAPKLDQGLQFPQCSQTCLGVPVESIA